VTCGEGFRRGLAVFEAAYPVAVGDVDTIAPRAQAGRGYEGAFVKRAVAELPLPVPGVYGYGRIGIVKGDGFGDNVRCEEAGDDRPGEEYQRGDSDVEPPPEEDEHADSHQHEGEQEAKGD